MLEKKYLKNGIVMAVLSSLLFSIMNVLVKITAATIPSNEIVFFRAFIGTILILILIKKENIHFSKTKNKMLVLRGLFGALYMLAYFYTISNMPLLDATILVSLSPVFTMFFAHIFLKEVISKKFFLILPIIFLGALLTVKPFGYSTYSMVAFFGILAAVFAAAANTSIRFLGSSGKCHIYTIIFAFMFVSTIVSMGLMWNHFVFPNMIEWIYLILIGGISLLAQVFLTSAFSKEKAVVVEFVKYIDVVFNALWGLLFWWEVPDIYTILGGSMILIGCILVSLKKPNSNA